MWRHFAGRDFPLEGFCKRLFPAEGFELGGISPHSLDAEVAEKFLNGI